MNNVNWTSLCLQNLLGITFYKLMLFTFYIFTIIILLLFITNIIFKSNDVKKIRYTAERTLIVSIMVGHFVVGVVGSVRD